VRKLEELGAAGRKPVEEIDPVAVRPRELAAVDANDEPIRGDTTGRES
jgi:hypothetical protein